MNGEQGQSQSQNQGARPAAAPQPGPQPGRPAPQPLLARYAECVLWLARYMERIENLARLLDVTRTFASDERDSRHWLAILRINSDEDTFAQAYPTLNADSVARFYLLDAANPTSISASIEQARENARSLRAVISTEIWSQINVFHGQVRALRDADIAPQNLSAVCEMLKDGVYAHTGIADGTFYRDQGWSFYAIGRHLERADQMTRLVDIKYAAMALAPGEARPPGLEAAQWDTLMRAAGGYHSYRRVYLRGYSAADVAGFLLLDDSFPRSVLLNLHYTHQHLIRLREGYGLQGGEQAIARLEALRRTLADSSADALVRKGLPPFLDWMQRELGAIYTEIRDGFFG